MAYDNDLRGAIFRNDRRRNERDPEYKGSCDIDGKQYWISSWINESKKDGSKYMSLRFKPKMAAEYEGAVKNPPPLESREAKEEEFDDPLPF
jgi:hypothetical protein